LEINSVVNSINIFRGLNLGQIAGVTGPWRITRERGDSKPPSETDFPDAIRVTISPEAKQLAGHNENTAISPTVEDKPQSPGQGLTGRYEESKPARDEKGPSEKDKNEDNMVITERGLHYELSKAEKAQVRELKRRDQEVRSHERAHMAAGAGYVRGGANFSYQIGPDGKRYAIGGEVSIDSSPVSGNPEATIRKAQVVRRAALAPADPSPQDRQVAAQAAQMERKALTELAKEKQAELAPAADKQGVAFDLAVKNKNQVRALAAVQGFTASGRNAVFPFNESSNPEDGLLIYRDLTVSHAMNTYLEPRQDTEFKYVNTYT